MKEYEVLVTKTNGDLEFVNFYEFSNAVILDEGGNVASVYVKSKQIGKIYDSDIDRVRDKRKEIVFERSSARLTRTIKT